MAQGSNLPNFQMPSHGWAMVKRIVRAYGAAQDDETSNVESVARLAGVQRPIVSGNNNFLRSIGILEIDKPKLTSLGVKLATGLGLENESITIDALQDLVRITPIFNQLLNTLRARGSMDPATFKGQIILGAGLRPSSPTLATIKTLTDLLEESRLIEVRDDKVVLGGQARVNDNDPMDRVIADRAQPKEALNQTTALGSGSASVNVWAEQLLSKFPQFDPAWPDEVKLKWFDAFDRLMKGRGL
jgi:hypothetical protein